MLRLLVLALSFLIGILLGIFAAGKVSTDLAAELAAYLTGYFQLSERGTTPALLLTTVFLYYRYPLLALLLGYASIGVILLPVFSALFAFFLAFSVSCLTAAFGPSGVLLAQAVFGLRCMVTVPCFFMIAVPALETSFSLVRVSLGGSRAATVSYGREWWMRAALCAAILAAAVYADLRFSPWLLRRLAADFIT